MDIDDKIIAVRCNIIINNTPTRAIVDTGAATNIITTTLLNALQIPIHKSSETRFIIANGDKQASLGKSKIEIELEEWVIPIEVEIIESNKNEILLGTRFLAEMNGKVDLKAKLLTLKVDNEEIKIPIWYTQKEMPLINELNEDSDSENSEEYEEIKDEIEVQLIHESSDSDNEDSENEEVKEIVLG